MACCGARTYLYCTQLAAPHTIHPKGYRFICYWTKITPLNKFILCGDSLGAGNFPGAFAGTRGVVCATAGVLCTG